MGIESFSGNDNLTSTIEKPKNNPLTKEQIEDFSISQRLYKERLKLVEQRATLRERNYDIAKQLLQENPNEIYFAKFEGQFYKNTISVIEETGKDNVNVDIIGRGELEEYIKAFEKQEQTSRNIDNLLRNNPNQEAFYELDGRYYISNPTRVPGDDVGSILRVKEVSRDEIEGKLEGFEKEVLRVFL